MHQAKMVLQGEHLREHQGGGESKSGRPPLVSNSSKRITKVITLKEEASSATGGNSRPRKGDSARGAFRGAPRGDGAPRGWGCT